MAAQIAIRSASDPDMDRMLKVIALVNSPVSGEAKNAARALFRLLDKRCMNIDRLATYFENWNEFGYLKTKARVFWKEEGLLKPEQPEPQVDIKTPEPKFAHEHEPKPGERPSRPGYIWIDPYSYTRKSGRIIHVRGHFRRHRVSKKAQPTWKFSAHMDPEEMALRGYTWVNGFTTRTGYSVRGHWRACRTCWTKAA